MISHILRLGFATALLCLIVGIPLVAEVSRASEPPPQVATLPDCDKCHSQQIADIESAGLAHKTKVSCRDCHPGHKPKSFENIPHCNNCHSGLPHFTLRECLPCHRNPHRPGEIRLTRKMTEGCLTCHPQPGAELREFPSYHSELHCTACHYEHGDQPVCLSCHRPHAAYMTQPDCLRCHQPHKPLVIAYSQDTASEDCGGCHEKALRLLKASPRKHNQLTCTFCHAERHKMIPACQSCHPAPHAEEILAKFPACSDCHGPAHDLQ